MGRQGQLKLLSLFLPGRCIGSCVTRICETSSLCSVNGCQLLSLPSVVLEIHLSDHILLIFHTALQLVLQWQSVKNLC